MHDYEAPIFDALADAIGVAYPSCIVASEDLPGQARFPIVEFRCTDITPDAASAESGDMEPRSVQLFEAQCYSNRSRAEAVELAKLCDSLMQSWGWRRTFFGRVDNPDPTVRRHVARWRGSVDGGGCVAR